MADEVISVSIADIFTAGVEMMMYNNAIKAAEKLDAALIDKFERNIALFAKLKNLTVSLRIPAINLL